jgi:DNA-binding MurR/RpiR family transcriptional regulator
MGVVDRITARADRLTPAERRVAAMLADEPQTVAFGTVATVARKAGTSGPSVVRLAVKLGYRGFVDLQSDVQQELARQLGPARERIRQPPPSDLIGRAFAAETANVSQTLSAVNQDAFRSAVAKLSDRRRQVFVLPGEMTMPAGQVVAAHLAQLRDGVTLLTGSEVAASKRLATLTAGDVVVVIDIRRYERWVLTVLRRACQQGASVVAITDSPLSPLGTLAAETFLMAAEGVGPFDSLVGVIALANALVAGVAARLRQSATSRLDAIEAAWAATNALVAEPAGLAPVVAGASTELESLQGTDETEEDEGVVATEEDEGVVATEAGDRPEADLSDADRPEADLPGAGTG